MQAAERHGPVTSGVDRGPAYSAWERSQGPEQSRKGQEAAAVPLKPQAGQRAPPVTRPAEASPSLGHGRAPGRAPATDLPDPKGEPRESARPDQVSAAPFAVSQLQRSEVSLLRGALDSSPGLRSPDLDHICSSHPTSCSSLPVLPRTSGRLQTVPKP